ncbi:hypothetical protein BIFGAL_04410 [Bifidobacterium gallicum DSM 20093 = LMG 11596]|uniref:Uncharacterized protein n=1 Tax=Bifidobacterium gallicum DSM 20093 = LMG 11596 TaxID=561180 RepID=D1NX02_9BIFI|nr:hypothetical protein BIFGAL_04410 [Bifidobacterium gallicum DSM 20093 = LMG 11596]
MFILCQLRVVHERYFGFFMVYADFYFCWGEHGVPTFTNSVRF